jgi:hypothetical protein
MPRRYAVPLLLAWTLLAGLLTPGPAIQQATAQTGSRYFPETQHTVQGLFLQYWAAHGGLAQQGYPLTDEFVEASAQDPGKSYTVQYFERAVFEHHPENAGTPYEVLLTQLGTYERNARYPGGTPASTPSTLNPQVFPETGHTIGGTFRAYWEAHGGLAQQGYPLTDEFQEASTLDPGKTYTVQYFERAIFELHPENAGTPFEVLLTQLGKYELDRRYPNNPHPETPLPEASPTPTLAPSTATPVATPTMSDGAYAATASVSNPHPDWTTNETVTGTLTRGGQPVAGAAMHTIWHYKTVQSNCDGSTDGSGIASCTLNIGHATRGHTVVIDVIFTAPDGTHVTASTSFTP